MAVQGLADRGRGVGVGVTDAGEHEHAGGDAGQAEDGEPRSDLCRP